MLPAASVATITRIMGQMPRLVAHLDMDAFYASVELLRLPELRGRPLVIGGAKGLDGGTAPHRLGDYSGRGVVTTATYEARKFGVHSGMGLMKAAALAPDALLLPVDFDEYRRLSREFKVAVARIAPHIEDRGIDEIYIDLSDVSGVRDAVGHDRWGGLRAVAQEIKNSVWAATRLHCSVGIAPNKLLAKVASELDKPDGLTLLMPEDLAERYAPLPVQRIHGIGPKSAARLQEMGITTVKDLALFDTTALIARFGQTQALWLHAAAQGQDNRAVVTSSEPVSFSRETTFERDLHPRNDRPLLTQALLHLCERVSADLCRRGYEGRTIGIKLRFDDFRTVTRDTTAEAFTDQSEAILHGSRECLKRVILSRRIRLLGVRISGLRRKHSALDESPRPPRAHQRPARQRERPGKTKTTHLAAGAADQSTLPLFVDPEGVIES